jgi:hypothetical protein
MSRYLRAILSQKENEAGSVTCPLKAMPTSEIIKRYCEPHGGQYITYIETKMT